MASLYQLQPKQAQSFFLGQRSIIPGNSTVSHEKWVSGPTPFKAPAPLFCNRYEHAELDVLPVDHSCCSTAFPRCTSRGARSPGFSSVIIR